MRNIVVACDMTVRYLTVMSEMPVRYLTVMSDMAAGYPRQLSRRTPTCVQITNMAAGPGADATQGVVRDHLRYRSSGVCSDVPRLMKMKE